ncbi:hypothetical protein PVL29_017810 [Vitis rotundifolia]|uniref:Uncharacterized protein n=1 Tax=Vitis rotundifolia TaxID=103349 RepID=A0AA39DL00_VITRO|nr:hypothetical protein PVL29_017810 [Vitis rotundifolia]
MAALTSVGVDANPSAGAGAVSTTTWNARDTGGGPMTSATANDVRLAAIFGFPGLLRISS